MGKIYVRRGCTNLFSLGKNTPSPSPNTQQLRDIQKVRRIFKSVLLLKDNIFIYKKNLLLPKFMVTLSNFSKFLIL